VKYLMQADLVNRPAAAEEKQIMMGNALMWRGRAYLTIDAESRENAFAQARAAGIVDAGGWGIAAEGDAQITEAVKVLGITPYWTTSDAAAAWGVTEIYVRKLCQAGRVKMAARTIEGRNVVWRFPAQPKPEERKTGPKPR
jgi:stage V sporulation protein SpoVS